MSRGKEIFVWISLSNKDYLIGKLWFHSKNGKESASFEYSKEWLNNSQKFALEPALLLTEGSFHTGRDQKLFGAMGDSAPDRWGRILMRRNRMREKNFGNTSRTLLEVDYLLGVNDYTRQGSLRFSENIDGPFLSDNQDNKVPPLVDLPILLNATEKFIDHDENLDDLRLLLAPGSSLGGARPKASVINKKGKLAIAKFPRRDDEYDLVAWEAVALTLAKNSGIEVPEWQIENIMDKNVLIVERFDRLNGNRIPFLSAMSMIGARDNEEHSYIEIAYAIQKYGVKVKEDLKNLWQRIIFNILISNTDDHLRNHAFLFDSVQGWKLSPIYDINPTPQEIRPRELSTSINFNENSASLDIALSVIDNFRLSNEEGYEIIREVYNAVSKWRNVAKGLGLNSKEINFMSSAFEHEDMEKASLV